MGVHAPSTDLHGILSMSADQMKLHEACINGRLADFLHSVLGELEIPSEALSDPYPLGTYPHAGMVATTTLITPESFEQDAAGKLAQQRSKAAIITILDAADAGMEAHMEHQAMFLNTGLAKHVSVENGKPVLHMSMRR
jgi:hypothetical protein